MSKIVNHRPIPRELLKVEKKRKLRSKRSYKKVRKPATRKQEVSAASI